MSIAEAMAVASRFQQLFFTAFAVFLCFSAVELAHSARVGFSVDLIHRDSPKSPFYDPSVTQFTRVNNALRRSIDRAQRIDPTSSGAAARNSQLSQIVNNGGEYLMNFTIGTPPFEVLAIADTGSDVLWTQCAPCSKCYKQKAPLFNPKKSTTYREVSCRADLCETMQFGTCSTGGANEPCHYGVSYGDRSHTSGVVAVDTISLGSANGRPVSLPKAIFGCGFDNGGTFDEGGSGIVGLGGGPASLIVQYDALIGGKFSYCLVSLSETKKSSKLNFGTEAVVAGAGVLTTPMASKSPDTFYYLTLKGITVGTQRLDYAPKRSANSSNKQALEEGNIIIDSGTTLTLLPPDLYSRLEASVSKQIDLEPIRGGDGTLSLCYRIQSNFEAPPIVLHLSGANVTLNTVNTFVQTSEDTVCFTFVASDSISIIGNLAQANFLVGYDLKKRTVSFKRTDCTRQ